MSLVDAAAVGMCWSNVRDDNGKPYVADKPIAHRLSDADIERIAQRVVELLKPTGRAGGRPLMRKGKRVG
jgi:hypothetical protein